MNSEFLLPLFTQEELSYGGDCSCGQRHLVSIQRIILEENLLPQVGGLLAGLGFTGCGFLVADSNTYTVAGKYVFQSLKDAGFPMEMLVFDQSRKVYPTAEYLVDIFDQVPLKAQFLVAVGSGTISDLVKFVAGKIRMPYVMVPTAPSMDGYACGVAALIRRGVRKSSYGLPAPRVIVADLEVLKDAPSEMIAAGIADLLGKFTSLADWQLAHCITGESVCSRAYTLMREAVNLCLQVDWARELRSVEGIRVLTEGLLKSGIAMLLAGTSRPASGSEHAIGHVLEMMEFEAGEPRLLHGLRIALTLPVSLELYRSFLSLSPRDLPKEPALWQPEVSWGSVTRYQDPELRHIQFQRLKEALPWLQREIGSWLPDPEQVRRVLAAINAPSSLEDYGISREDFHRAVRQATVVRERYTVLDALADVGMLDSAVERLF